MAFPERVGRLSRGRSWDRKERGTSHGDQEEPSELCEQTQERGHGKCQVQKGHEIHEDSEDLLGCLCGAGGDLCQAGDGD